MEERVSKETKKTRIFDKIEEMHEEQIQLSGKTNSESETKKEEGWN